MPSAKTLGRLMVLVTGMVCGNSPANASLGATGSIVSFIVQNDGKFFFFHNGSRDNLPGCATTGNRWVVDASTAAGQALMSGLLTAYTSHKRLTVHGTNDCRVWGDTETVSYVEVYD